MKRKTRGRPPIYGKPGQRYQVHLPPHFAAYLRRLGNGSLSRGICRLVNTMRSP